LKQRCTNRAALAGIELEYEKQGAGEPVVLIHPGHFADWFTPLLDEPALIDHYLVLSYHRVGCAGSSHIAGPVSFAQQAAHCRSLMRHLGIERAHVVGHSSSGNIALQLALDAPETVRSLALLEPALMSVPSAQTSRAFLGTAIELYRAGNKAGAVDTFLQGTCGPGYRAVLDHALPGAFDQHVADADTGINGRRHKRSMSPPIKKAKAAALQFLAATGDAKYLPLFKTNVGDSSYSVAGAALSALAALEPANAYPLAKKYSTDAKGDLSTAVNDIIMSNGTEADFDLVAASYDKAPLSREKVEASATFESRRSGTAGD